MIQSTFPQTLNYTVDNNASCYELHLNETSKVDIFVF